MPFEWKETVVGEDQRPQIRQLSLREDEHLRRGTTVEGLAQLRPVFRKGGRVTAGNSSPLSDGAAAVLLMEAGRAAQLGLQPLARFVGFQVAGVRPEIMGVGADPRHTKTAGTCGYALQRYRSLRVE